MTIEELAKRKVDLKQRLQSISMVNIAYHDSESLIDLEISRIKSLKELNEVEREIRRFVEGN
jgi:hypothetical protein